MTNDTEVLIRILDYLNDYEEALCMELAHASESSNIIISAKISAVSNIINYIEDTLGVVVRVPE